MATYDYNCPQCGFISSLRRGYDDYSISCPTCGGTAERVPVYYSQGLVIRGGPNAPMPRQDDVESTQDEYRKEVRKRGWSADRAIQELRANKITDANDQLRIDTRKMTKTA